MWALENNGGMLETQSSSEFPAQISEHPTIIYCGPTKRALSALYNYVQVKVMKIKKINKKTK